MYVVLSLDMLASHGTEILVKTHMFMGLSISRLESEQQVSGFPTLFESKIYSFATPVGPLITGQVTIISCNLHSQC
jgi:hypothetical protein